MFLIISEIYIYFFYLPAFLTLWSFKTLFGKVLYHSRVALQEEKNL